MKKYLFICLIFFIAFYSIGQNPPTSDNINSIPNGHTLVNYKRIGNILYISYEKHFFNEDYPTDYPGIEYYVSSSNGNDSNDGLTPETAFASFTPINNLTILPGDAILLYSQDIFIGQLTVNGSGNVSYPITVAPYGNSDFQPAIMGSAPLTNWTQHKAGSNIYRTKYTPTTPETDITQLFYNSERMQVARNTNTSYNKVTSLTNTTTFTSTELNTSINYAGSVAIMRGGTYYRSYKRNVISSSGNTLTIDANIAISNDALAANQYFLLMNEFEFLDAPGEFYYNPTTDSVYFWSPYGTDPDLGDVRGSVYTNGVYCFEDYVNIENLNIHQQKETGIKLHGSYLNIRNNKISHQELFGIWQDGGSSDSTVVVDGNEIYKVNSHGIFMYTVPKSTISNNYIHDISSFEDWGLEGTGQYDAGNGMSISCRQSTIEYNVVDYIGYNGIFWRYPQTIRYNHVKTACTSKGDGGGIYCGSNTVAGTTITYNIVEDVVGNKEGTVNLVFGYGEGIYIDETSLSVTVENNAVRGSGANGIFLHRPAGMTVRYNTVLDSRRAFQIKGGINSTPNTITYNKFITGSSTDLASPYRQLLTAIGSSYNNEIVYATINNNTYLHPFNSTSNLEFANQPIGSGETFYTFSGFKGVTGYDLNSTVDSTALGVGETQWIVSNPSKTAKQFWFGNHASAIKDENGAIISDGFVINSYEHKYVEGVNPDCIQSTLDETAPVVTAFDIPTTGTSFTVPILAYTGDSDTKFYKITTTATAPATTLSLWTDIKPIKSFTVTGDNGEFILYAWVRDAAGNVSAYSSDTITITTPYPIATENLLAVWKMDETTGVAVEDLISNNDGLASNTTIVDGKFTKARSYNGTTSYTTFATPTIANTGMTSDFTIHVWANMSTFAAYKRILNIKHSAGNHITLYTDASNVITADVDKSATVYGFKNTTVTVSTGTWHLYTITWDASESNLDFYIDGVNQTVGLSNNATEATANNMTIGAKTDNTSLSNCIVDEVVISTVFSTATDVANMYNSGNGVEY